VENIMAQPRAYSRHQRYRKNPATANLGAGSRKQFAAFLAAEATRLSSTSALIFGKLTTNIADRIRATDTFGHLA
jgi:hypothetical protein